MIGCASCHVPVLRTGQHPIRALSRKTVYASTDLLLHDMGEELSDICNGEALPWEFRTEPLMGLRFSTISRHDGRATTIEQAIELHANEGTRSREQPKRRSRPVDGGRWGKAPGLLPCHPRAHRAEVAARLIGGNAAAPRSGKPLRARRLRPQHHVGAVEPHHIAAVGLGSQPQ